MELLLIRHALPMRRELALGAADPELSAVGRAQSGRLASYLADEQLDAVYASPLRRAVETAAPVAAIQCVDVMVDEGVAEHDRDWPCAVPVDDDPRWQSRLDASFPMTLGVDPAAFDDRIRSCIEQIIARHPSGVVAVVAHGGVINRYLVGILGLDVPIGFFYPAYTSIQRVVASTHGARSLLTLNETAHLRGTDLAGSLRLT